MSLIRIKSVRRVNTLKFSSVFYLEDHFISLFWLTTRMHSSRMRTGHSSSCPGGLHQAPPWSRPSPPEADPLGAGTHCGKASWDSTPHVRHAGIPPAMHAGIAPPCCKACWDTTCSACWDTTRPVNRMTNGCKNIALPQISFAGGNNFKT